MGGQGFGPASSTVLITKSLTWDPTTPIFDQDGNYNRFSEKSLANNKYPILAAPKANVFSINAVG